MIIAEELDLPLDKVVVTLADARPELLFNQLTGGSNTTTSTYTPIRVAAAIARGALLDAAAIVLGDERRATWSPRAGSSQTRAGAACTYGELAEAAAATQTRRGRGDAQGRRPASGSSARGAGRRRRARRRHRAARTTRSTSRSRARCRRWSAGRPRSTARRSGSTTRREVLQMPGVDRRRGRRHRRRGAGQDVRPVHRRGPRAEGRRGTAGTVAGQSDADVARASSRAAELPLAAAARSPLAKTLEGEFTSTSAATPRSRPTAPSPTSAPTGPRSGRRLKSPIAAQAADRPALGLPQTAVTVHVVAGRRLVRPPAVLRRRPRGRADLARRWASR